MPGQELQQAPVTVVGAGSFQPPPHVMDGPCWCETLDEYEHPKEND